MRQQPLFLRAIPARVRAAEQHLVRLTLLAYPRIELPICETSVPATICPSECVEPHADVWLICRRSLTGWADALAVCPRQDRELPEAFRQQLVDSAKAEAQYLERPESEDGRKQAASNRWEMWHSGG